MVERIIPVTDDHIAKGSGIYEIGVVTTEAPSPLGDKIESHLTALGNPVNEMDRRMLKGVLVEEKPDNWIVIFTENYRAPHTHITRRVLGERSRTIDDSALYDGQFELHGDLLAIWGRTEAHASKLLHTIATSLPNGKNIVTEKIVGNNFANPVRSSLRALTAVR